MQKEINKYQGWIFYLEERKDKYNNRLAPIIKPATWINSTKDYSHSLELHHVVPYTDWELNTRNVQNIIKNNALILIPNTFERPMHQHLENPEYKLDKEDFEKKYLINPDVILFDINSKLPRTADVFMLDLKKNEYEYDGCFDDMGSVVCCGI